MALLIPFLLEKWSSHTLLTGNSGAWNLPGEDKKKGRGEREFKNKLLSKQSSEMLPSDKMILARLKEERRTTSKKKKRDDK